MPLTKLVRRVQITGGNALKQFVILEVNESIEALIDNGATKSGNELLTSNSTN